MTENIATPDNNRLTLKEVIARGIADKLSGGFFPVPDLVDAQHGDSAVTTTELQFCQRVIRFRIG